MHKVFLIIGGNVGDREWYLAQTRANISKDIGAIIKKSDIYESEPWGFDHHITFLNQVLEVETDLTALCLLDKCQNIERELGRDRFSDGYRPRTVDIDVLFYDDCIYSLPPLIIPHKHLHNRMFVLEPLAQIAPNFIHPIFGISVSDLREACSDSLKVWRYQYKGERV
jgi:2-amino-4-hydroxy-6-hydroxymethyldihydropteridine diphosphokinase